MDESSRQSSFGYKWLNISLNWPQIQRVGIDLDKQIADSSFLACSQHQYHVKMEKGEMLNNVDFSAVTWIAIYLESRWVVSFMNQANNYKQVPP